MVVRSASELPEEYPSRSRANSAPPNRVPLDIWLWRNLLSWPWSIFSMFSRAAMSPAMPSSMPEETIFPS